MDKREGTEQNLYKKELERDEENEYNEYVEEAGVKYRVPYKMVREVVFTNLKKEELIDTEHAARLQYRILLLEPVLRGKVEFVTRKITITYNPQDAENRKDKMSLQEIIAFLAKEGVHVAPADVKERDVDYYREIYAYQYSPPSIREHPPYGYTLDEWKRIKAEYFREKAEHDVEKKEKFKKWQMNYLYDHPELAAELGIKLEAKKPQKPTLLSRVFKKKEEGEKGFWFHGV